MNGPVLPPTRRRSVGVRSLRETTEPRLPQTTLASLSRGFALLLLPLTTELVPCAHGLRSGLVW